MTASELPHIVIVGADPAGVFAALSSARAEAKVTLLAPDDNILPTWRDNAAIAHGLTREIWDPAELAEELVAGGKEMIGPFTRYGPGDFETWAEAEGLPFNVDAHGAVTTSESIGALTEFFKKQLAAQSVDVKLNAPLKAVDVKSTGGFWLTLADERTIQADQLIIAGGSLISNPLARVVTDLGHTVTELFPALTGFQSMDKRLRGLQDIQLNACEVRVGDTERSVTGRVELEPWGFSGPAVWQLSAEHTDQLHKLHYRFPLRISWLEGGSRAAAKIIDEQLKSLPNAKLAGFSDERLPSKLWNRLLASAGLTGEESWDTLSPPQRSALVRELSAGEFEIVKKKNVRGVSAVKGGVATEEVDFRTFASRKIPQLYFAGNALDVCAHSPELNLQIDWTSGWLAGQQAAGLA